VFTPDAVPPGEQRNATHSIRCGRTFTEAEASRNIDDILSYFHKECDKTSFFYACSTQAAAQL